MVTFEYIYLQAALLEIQISNKFFLYIEGTFLNMNSSSAKLEFYKTVFNRATPWKERIYSILYNGTDAEFLKCNSSIIVDTAYNLKPLYLNWKSRVDQEHYSIYMATDEIGESQVGWYMECAANGSWKL